MNDKSTIEGKVLSFATYKPKQGHEEELMKLVATHLPMLRESGLATDKASYLAKSSDGSIIEIFEWTSGDAVNKAHQDPLIAVLWDKMSLLADFFPISNLQECSNPFTGFQMID